METNAPRRRWLSLRDVYSDPLDRLRARNVLYVIFTATFAYSLVAVIALLLNWLGTPVLSQGFIFVGLILPVYAAFTWLLIRRGLLGPASTLFMFMTVVAVFVARASTDSNNALVLVMPILIAAVTSNTFGIVATAIFILLISGYDVFILENYPARTPPSLFYFYNVVLLSFATFIVLLMSNNLQRLSGLLSAQIARTRRSIGRGTVGTMDESEETLILRTLATVREDLGYNFAQVFLIEEDHKSARRLLQIMGMEQLQLGESVDLGGATAVAEAMRTRRPFVVTNQSSEVRRRYLLPGARASIVLPLISGGEVLGALDVQQERSSRWSDTEVEALEFVASQLASAIAQARQFQQLNQNIKDQEELILRQRQRLRELEKAESMAAYQAWQNFLREEGVDMFGYNLTAQGLRPAEDFSPEMQASMKRGEIVVERRGDQQWASVPIVLRDQVIGALSFAMPPGQVLTSRQSDLLQSVVQRLGLALENRRLFEQSQAQAQRETKANEIASILLSTTDVETVLNLAADQFNQALGAIQTRITLTPPTIEAHREGS
ncbi:MAG: GAF domain-containing protein [Anaerolineae bacterium]|nr:GAF domain-containing protein [Anaerolineae bacterium]MDW8173674.1 GAF domain-containing protein [Anaerolineae bacterium]